MGAWRRRGIHDRSSGIYLDGMSDEISIRFRYQLLSANFDERGRRLFAAAESRAAGHGGVAGVVRATGLARSTIGRGLADLGGLELAAGKVRRAGG